MLSVLVTFPTSPAHPYLHKQVVFASWRLLSDKRYRIHPIIPTHNPFENNLHHIVKDFVADDYDYWLSMDADNPPMKNPLDLVEYDLDIVGFPTPIWHFDMANKKRGERPIYWNAYDYVAEKDAYCEHEPKEGVQRVDAIGTGCFLVAQRVFQNSVMQKGAFQRQFHNNGTVNKGNDLSFCERARAQGFEIYAHYDYPCMHFEQVELTEVIAAFRNVHGS
jgi:hypothetical protein